MAVKLDDIDALLGYDEGTHSLKGLPSIAKPGPLQPSAKELASPPTTIPSIAPAPAPEAPGTMPSVMPTPGTASPTAGIPSIDTGASPTLAKPKESVWQKLGHGLEKGAEVAGDVLATGVTAMVPGTKLNKEAEAGKELRREGEEANTGFKQAQLAQNPIELYQMDPEKFRQYHDMVADQEKTGDPVKDIKQDDQGNEIAVLSSGKTMPLNFKGQQKEDDKTPAHITVMGKDGKSHIMERDPQTGDYSIDRGEAPPNYAMVAPSLRTVDVIDSKTGLPTVQTLGGRQIGVSGTGAYGHEMEQAGAVERAGTALIQTVQANKNKFGNIGAILNSAFLGTPVSDPESSGLVSQIKSFAALNPSMHGFRGKDALNEFVKLLGGLPNNPDSLIAGIQGILKTAGAINPALQSGGGTTSGGGTPSFDEWKKSQGK